MVPQSCGRTELPRREPKPSGTQYPVYRLSALWKPQQCRAQAEARNSLQFAEVAAKVAALSVTLLRKTDAAAAVVSDPYLRLRVFVSRFVSAELKLVQLEREPADAAMDLLLEKQN